jgi:hypothetical protein
VSANRRYCCHEIDLKVTAMLTFTLQIVKILPTQV